MSIIKSLVLLAHFSTLSAQSIILSKTPHWLFNLSLCSCILFLLFSSILLTLFCCSSCLFLSFSLFSASSLHMITFLLASSIIFLAATFSLFFLSSSIFLLFPFKILSFLASFSFFFYLLFWFFSCFLSPF